MKARKNLSKIPAEKREGIENLRSEFGIIPADFCFAKKGELAMKIKFLGAIGEVTGSCTWCILDSSVQFLVDCGSFQGWDDAVNNRQKFPFDPEKIRFVLLTHAHADHCGRIPLLYKRGFEGVVHCTSATRDLAKLNFLDMVKIYNARASKDGVPPLFTKHDVEKVKFVVIDEHAHGFGQPAKISIEKNFWVHFNRSSHMLGAASVTVSWGGSADNAKRITFSGDVGNNREGSSYQALLKRNQIPHKSVCYVVLESTYGAKPRRDSEYQNAVNRIEALKKIVCASEYRMLIFPCFAIQRTQEILFDLFCALEYCNNDDTTKYRIVLDSPMAIKTGKIFKKHLIAHNPADREKRIYLNDHCVRSLADHYGVEIDSCRIIENVFDGPGYETEKLSVNGEFGAKFNQFIESKNRVPTTDEAMDTIPSNGGASQEDIYANGSNKIILITSSGMCQEGKIRMHLRELKHPATALVLTGYQSTDNGVLLQRLAAGERGDIADKELTTSGKPLLVKNIRGKVFNLGAYYSGHADVDNLLRFLFERAGDKGHAETLKGVTVFLNHGDEDARIALKKLIENRDSREGDVRKVRRVIIPSLSDRFYDLDKNEYVSETDEIIQNQLNILEKLDELLVYAKAGENKPKKKKDKS